MGLIDTAAIVTAEVSNLNEIDLVFTGAATGLNAAIGTKPEDVITKPNVQKVIVPNQPLQTNIERSVDNHQKEYKGL